MNSQISEINNKINFIMNQISNKDNEITKKNESKKIPTKAPKLGEHTKEILSTLGQDEEEIAQLKQDGIIDF